MAYFVVDEIINLISKMIAKLFEIDTKLSENSANIQHLEDKAYCHNLNREELTERVVDLEVAEKHTKRCFDVFNKSILELETRIENLERRVSEKTNKQQGVK